MEYKKGAFTLKKGFTLAEILITLGIIGVVAAMTIPVLAAKIREKQTVALVKEAHAIFAQAYRQVASDYDGLEALVTPGDTDKQNANATFKEVTSHIKKAKSCDVDTDCMGATYVNLVGKSVGSWDYYANVQTGIMLNGVSFWILSIIKNGEYYGELGIDINGSAKPNKIGVDFFHFGVKSDGTIIPNGSYSKGRGTNYGCSISGNNAGNFNLTYNGYGCTHWLLTHENMNYLKQEIYMEGKDDKGNE